MVTEPPEKAVSVLLDGSNAGNFQCQWGVYPSWGNMIFYFVDLYLKTILGAWKFAKIVQRVSKSF